MDENWENEIETITSVLSLSSKNDSSFGKPASTNNIMPTFGRGRGYVSLEEEEEKFMFMGRGKPINSNHNSFGGFKKSDENKPASQNTNFSYQNNNDDDGWNETESTFKPSSNNTSHQTRESTGFGSAQNSFGSSRSSKFGRSDNEEGTNKGFGSGIRGGFGSFSRGGGAGGRSSKGCFKCGEEGHMSRECPNNDGSNTNKGCFKCGKEGHMSRDCPNNESSNRSKGCFKCGEEGHMSRDCPNNDSSNRSKGCFKCGEEGHMSRDCPNNDSSNRSKGCFKCGEEGHMSRDCPNNDSSNRNKGCFKCGEEGHMSRDCTNNDSSNRSKGCFKCGEEGHMSRDCPKGGNSNSKDGKGCFKCGETGHFSKDCTKPSTDSDGKPREIYIPPEITDENLFDGISTGVNFDNYDNIPVRITGNGNYKPIMKFQDAGIRDLLKQNIQKANYLRPTPIQKYSIPIILANRDLMACAQTGSGKTAAFLVPIINGLLSGDLQSASFKETQEPLSIILSPTRELAIQIYSEARKFSYGTILSCAIAYGGTSVGYQRNKLKQGCHLLVATPGRLMDYVRRSEISFSQLKYLVLDEADRMLDMGFLSSIREIVGHSTTPPKEKRLTLMFSATFPTEIQTLAGEFLNDYMFICVGNIGSANTDVEQTFYEVEKFSKRNKLLEILQETISEGEKVLVFVETKRNADFIAAFMSQKGFPTTSIHGDRLQREREEALTDFRMGRMVVLVATAVAARGLDIKNVNVVVNYDLPQTIEEYVHRIGRTGRVGNTGRAISFYDSSTDQQLARALLLNLQSAQQPVPDWLESESMGMGSYSSQSSGNRRFGAKDIRGFKANDENEHLNYVHGAGFGNVGGINEEESWD